MPRKKARHTSLQEQSHLNLDKTYQTFCILQLPFEFLSQYQFSQLAFLAPPLFLLLLSTLENNKEIENYSVGKTCLPKYKFFNAFRNIL